MPCRGSLLASLGLDSWREARLGSDGAGGGGAGAAGSTDVEASLGKKDGGGVPGRAASRYAACAFITEIESRIVLVDQFLSSGPPVLGPLPLCYASTVDPYVSAARAALTDLRKQNGI